MVDLAPHAHRLGERRRPDGEDHKLLHRQRVAGVRASVDDVERGDGEHQLGVTREVGDVAVERHALLGGAGLADGHGDGEDRVGAELALVLGAVERVHLGVHGLLVRRVAADERRADEVVDVGDGLGDALAHVLAASVAELDCLVDARGGSRGDGGGEDALVGVDVGLDGGVAAMFFFFFFGGGAPKKKKVRF